MTSARPVALGLALATLGLVLASGSPTAQEQDYLVPGILGQDDRKPVDLKLHPQWGAIGHVNVRGFRRTSGCTGTLIAPRVVLTAAHCVVDRWAKTIYAPSRIIFIAGVSRGAHVDHAVAACVKLKRDSDGRDYLSDLPSFTENGLPLTLVTRDLAVIVLREQVNATGIIPPLRADPAPDQVALIHAGYPADRRYALHADSTCKRLERRNDLWVTDCDTYPANSGGPILVRDGTKLRVAAVMSGVVAGKATIAVPVSSWPEMPLQIACP